MSLILVNSSVMLQLDSADISSVRKLTPQLVGDVDGFEDWDKGSFLRIWLY